MLDPGTPEVVDVLLDLGDGLLARGGRLVDRHLYRLLVVSHHDRPQGRVFRVDHRVIHGPESKEADIKRDWRGHLWKARAFSYHLTALSISRSGWLPTQWSRKFSPTCTGCYRGYVNNLRLGGPGRMSSAGGGACSRAGRGPCSSSSPTGCGLCPRTEKSFPFINGELYRLEDGIFDESVFVLLLGHVLDYLGSSLLRVVHDAVEVLHFEANVFHSISVLHQMVSEFFISGKEGRLEDEDNLNPPINRRGPDLPCSVGRRGWPPACCRSRVPGRRTARSRSCCSTNRRPVNPR